MPESSEVIVGLEIGTSKICTVIGELTESGALSVIGLGQAKSRGVRKGEIVDAPKTVEDIRNAIADAEQMADAEVRSVYLGVTGAHVRGFSNHGSHRVASDDREIGESDVQDVVKNAKAINLPAENTTIHVVRQLFTVDGQRGVHEPVGMLGAKLEVDVHVIHGQTTRIQNSVRAVKEVNLEVNEIVFNGLAASLAVLTPQQKEMGTVVIDLGGGVTEYTVHIDGVVRHSGVIAVGGDHVANDLAYGLKVPLGRAEQLKLEYGAAAVDAACRGQMITLPTENGLPERQISQEHLRMIMAARLEETFQLIEEDISEAGLMPFLRDGVLLCGGTARVPGITELAARIFNLPVSVGRTQGISGLSSALDQPEFVTAIGLVRFGSMLSRRRNRENFLARSFKDTFTQIFRRA